MLHFDQLLCSPLSAVLQNSQFIHFSASHFPLRRRSEPTLKACESSSKDSTQSLCYYTVCFHSITITTGNNIECRSSDTDNVFRVSRSHVGNIVGSVLFVLLKAVAAKITTLQTSLQLKSVNY